MALINNDTNISEVLDTVRSKGSNLSSASDQHTEKSSLHMYQYLQRVGDEQREALEKFYHTAVEMPCRSLNKCEDISYLNCSFFQKNIQQRRQYSGTTAESSLCIIDRAIIGPVACEYCQAKTSIECSNTCERPELYFVKRRPPFENTKEQWNSRGCATRMACLSHYRATRL